MPSFLPEGVAQFRRNIRFVFATQLRAGAIEPGSFLLRNSGPAISIYLPQTKLETKRWAYLKIGIYYHTFLRMLVSFFFLLATLIKKKKKLPY